MRARWADPMPTQERHPPGILGKARSVRRRSTPRYPTAETCSSNRSTRRCRWLRSPRYAECSAYARSRDLEFPCSPLIYDNFLYHISNMDKLRPTERSSRLKAMALYRVFLKVCFAFGVRYAFSSFHAKRARRLTVQIVRQSWIASCSNPRIN